METKPKAHTGELPSICHVTDDMRMTMTDGNGEATRENGSKILAKHQV